VIHVGVLGAAGRMGRTVVGAVVADPELVFVAAVDPSHEGVKIQGVPLSASLDALKLGGAEVAVDFTRADAAVANVKWCLENGIHAVVGTTGISREALEELGKLSAERSVNVIVAPNFSTGAVLMMALAEKAAHYLPSVEIVELHHEGKADAPSGTSIFTAKRIAAARTEAPPPKGGDELHLGARGVDVDGIRIHAVRLPGLLAHQEVILGGPGETLTIRHDSTDRASFMPGVVLAVKSVASRPGLTLGLESLLDL
jgi:4-hydroxy-tetrahydrodipicolinate reductase